MRFQAVLSLGLLGSIPNALSILQKRDHSSMSTLSVEETSFVQWGEAYQQVNLEETSTGYVAHIFERSGSCYMSDVTIGPQDSIYRFENDVESQQECHAYCFADVRCAFARYFKEEKVCQFLDFSTTPMGNGDPNVVLINGDCHDKCFLKDKKFEGEAFYTREAAGPLHCHNLCMNNLDCSNFSYDPASRNCYMFDSSVTETSAASWVSGTSKSCYTKVSGDTTGCDMTETPEFCDTSCHMHNVKYGTGYGMSQATNAFQCHKDCHDDEKCWNWSFVGGVCYLKNGADSVQTFYEWDAISGPRFPCGEKPKRNSVYNVNAAYNSTKVLLVINEIDQVSDCEALCRHRRRCTGFTLNYAEKVCTLFKLGAPIPVTSLTFTPLITSVTDAAMLPSCSQYNQALVASESPVVGEIHSLLQCVESARKTDGIVGYLWRGGQCYLLNSASQVEAATTESQGGIYGSTQLCLEPYEEKACYLDKASVKADLNRFVTLPNMEACYERCQLSPACIATVWQYNKRRCHLMDNARTAWTYDNNAFASRSCNSTCFDHGFDIKDSVVVETLESYNAEMCQVFCISRKSCLYFSYNTNSKMCTIHKTAGRLVKDPQAVSGDRMYCNAPYNFLPKELEEPVDGWDDISTEVNIVEIDESDLDKCELQCQQTENCRLFTYSFEDKRCFLKDTLPLQGLLPSQEHFKDKTDTMFSSASCYSIGSVPSSSKTLAESTYPSVSECMTLCASLEPCMGIQYNPESKLCQVYDLEAFIPSVSDSGSNIVKFFGSCS